MKKITLAKLQHFLGATRRAALEWRAQLYRNVLKWRSSGSTITSTAQAADKQTRTKAGKLKALKIQTLKPASLTATELKSSALKSTGLEAKSLTNKQLNTKPLKPKPPKQAGTKSSGAKVNAAKFSWPKHPVKSLQQMCSTAQLTLAQFTGHVKRCNLFYKWALSVCLSLILLTGSVSVAINSLTAYPEQALKLDKPTQVTIAAGMSVTKLVQQLEQQGLLTDSWKIKYLVKLKPELAQIRTGLYELFPSDTLGSFLQRVLEGKVVTFSVTLVEGKSIKEWQSSLDEQPRLSLSEAPFLTVLKAHGDDSGLPEGKFYPETYYYHADESVVDVLNRSYVMMQSALNAAWEGRSDDVQVKSAYELLILASIIEKETGQASERPLISAVFNNRLKLGMRLQTDPTVIYGMGERFKGNITRKDLQEATAFNTYKIKGLPPTPIAAPSQAALEAAANPAAVDYLYFVSRNDGSHVFSKTLKAHNAAVNQYQRRKKK